MDLCSPSPVSGRRQPLVGDLSDIFGSFFNAIEGYINPDHEQISEGAGVLPLLHGYFGPVEASFYVRLGSQLLPSQVSDFSHIATSESSRHAKVI